MGVSREGCEGPRSASWGILSGLLPAHPKVLIYASTSTGQDDLSFAGYQKHLSSCAAPAPLTSAERELQQIRINEVGALDRVGRSPGPRPSRSRHALLAKPVLPRWATPWFGHVRASLNVHLSPGEDRDQCGEQTPDPAGPGLPSAASGPAGTSAAQTEDSQLHPAGGCPTLSQAHTQGVLHLHPAPAHMHVLTSAHPHTGGNTLPSIPTCSLQ